MIRRGVPQKVAMRVGGWKTPSVSDRYNIVDEEDLRIAAEKIEAGAKRELEQFRYHSGITDAKDDSSEAEKSPVETKIN
jgi:hypothetical protein